MAPNGQVASTRHLFHKPGAQGTSSIYDVVDKWRRLVRASQPQVGLLIAQLPGSEDASNGASGSQAGIPAQPSGGKQQPPSRAPWVPPDRVGRSGVKQATESILTSLSREGLSWKGTRKSAEMTGRQEKQWRKDGPWGLGGPGGFPQPEEGQCRTTQVQASPSCDSRCSEPLAPGDTGPPALSLPVLIPM